MWYQYPPAPGQRVGRYIGSCADEAHAETAPLTLTDLRRPEQVFVADARALVPLATLATRGFELRAARTAATAADLADADSARRVYYPEVEVGSHG